MIPEARSQTSSLVGCLPNSFKDSGRLKPCNADLRNDAVWQRHLFTRPDWVFQECSSRSVEALVNKYRHRKWPTRDRVFGLGLGMTLTLPAINHSFERVRAHCLMLGHTARYPSKDLSSDFSAAMRVEMHAESSTELCFPASWIPRHAAGHAFHCSIW